MSDTTFKVPYTTILNITPHSNADRLEVAWVYGFQVIVQKNKFKVGDHVVYIPIDAILPNSLEQLLFPPDAKIKLRRSRVRQIRIRGLASQGMIVSLDELAPLAELYGDNWHARNFYLEQDLKSVLGITKFEPPETVTQQPGTPKKRKKDHPLFNKYNGLDNIKWFPDFFQPYEQVIIQEKLHGTNCRAGVLPYNAENWWKKILKFLHLTPAFEEVYGSNNVQIKHGYSGFYGKDIYKEALDLVDAFNKLPENVVIYGEVVGPRIQKNYDYGIKVPTFVLFDVQRVSKSGSKYVNPEDAEEFAYEHGFHFVPVLYRGAFDKDLAYSFTKGPSKFDPNTKIREGIVIKSRFNYDIGGGKRALKWVSEDYLDDQSNTDFH